MNKINNSQNNNASIEIIGVDNTNEMIIINNKRYNLEFSDDDGVQINNKDLYDYLSKNCITDNNTVINKAFIIIGEDIVILGFINLIDKEHNILRIHSEFINENMKKDKFNLIIYYK